MKRYKIDFQPVGRRAECSDKETVLDCARYFGVGISSICGGAGTCRACKIQVVSGSTSKPTQSELKAFSDGELKDGWRLACQTYILSDCIVSIPPESMTTPQRLQIEGLEVAIAIEPAVKTYRVSMAPPSLTDLTADADRLVKSLNQQHHRRCRKIDTALLRTLSPRLRAEQWQCRVSVRQDEIVSVDSLSSQCLGLAVDLGTTKIAGYLIDLSNGKTLSSRGLMNPQISYGEDVISRITQVIQSENSGKKLQRMLIDALNGLAKEMCSEAGARTENITDAVVVGNTAMHHLFLGLPVRQLALSPYVPAVSQALDIKARDMNLKLAPGAYVHLLPNIAGFVGADHVAGLLAAKAWDIKDTVLFIDIGTNTEISLVTRGAITAVSCASGPAFEGGHIKHGMRAASGAIERVRIMGDAVHCQTIDNAPPVGICGSGILDTMAQLHLSGIIDRRGKLDGDHPRLRNGQGQREFVLVENQDGHSEIVVTQRDIRELQIAKAAISAGIQALLEVNRCTEEDIQQVIVAGAFGNYIDISSAITTGMLPALPLERFHQVGNAASTGARLALISRSQRMLAQKIARKVHYLELARVPDFMQLLIQASYIGQYHFVDSREEAL